MDFLVDFEFQIIHLVLIFVTVFAISYAAILRQKMLGNMSGVSFPMKNKRLEPFVEPIFIMLWIIGFTFLLAILHVLVVSWAVITIPVPKENTYAEKLLNYAEKPFVFLLEKLGIAGS